VQQRLLKVNPYGVSVGRVQEMAGFLRYDLGLPVENSTHFFCNMGQLPKRPVVERKEPNARHPWPPYILVCVEAAVNVEKRVFNNTTVGSGCPGAWPVGRYNDRACDGQSPLGSMLAHRRIEVEVMQRIKMCQNPDMIVDLARLILVSMFWASGRGADASGMSVKEYHSNIATPFPPNPIRNPSWCQTRFTPRSRSGGGGGENQPKRFEGELKRYTPVGWVENQASNAEWRMQFIWPFRAEYHILYVNDEYTETIIAHPSRNYAWIMLRQPEVSDAAYEGFLQKLEAAGYDRGIVQKLPQDWSEESERLEALQAEGL